MNEIEAVAAPFHVLLRSKTHQRLNACHVVLQPRTTQLCDLRSCIVSCMQSMRICSVVDAKALLTTITP